MSIYGDRAYAYFMQGFNCSQSVAAAFSDLVGIEDSALLRMSSGFGAGVGRLREVCGALSGAVLILSLLYGSDDPEGKTAIYARVQELADTFQKHNPAHSYLCRELLGLDHAEHDPTAGKRTSEYYQNRPCPGLVRLSADLLADYIHSHPYSNKPDKS